MSRINDKNGSRVSGFGVRAMALVAMLAPCALFAGNWTLDTSTGVLTSENGEWSLSGCALANQKLTVGAVTAAAADGILDFRSAKVNNTSVSVVTFNRGTGKWKTAAIKEFYCDRFDRLEKQMLQGNTTIEKIWIGTLDTLTAFESAFEGCTSLREVHFGAPLNNFYAKSFYNCNQLDMDIADLVAANTSSVAKQGLTSCRKLHGKLTLTNTGNFYLGSFSGVGVEEVVINSPNITGWQNTAFKNCSSLTNLVVICPNLTSIAHSGSAFDGCTALRKITLDIPNMSSFDTQHSAAHFFGACSALSEVVIKNAPWTDSEGNSLVRSWLNRHLLSAVTPVAATVDAPKNCTIYALRSDYKPYASAMMGDYERPNAPKRCYGVYVSGSSRLAYMVQDPDYRPGFFISAK